MFGINYKPTCQKPPVARCRNSFRICLEFYANRAIINTLQIERGRADGQAGERSRPGAQEESTSPDHADGAGCPYCLHHSRPHYHRRYGNACHPGLTSLDFRYLQKFYMSFGRFAKCFFK